MESIFYFLKITFSWILDESANIDEIPTPPAFEVKKGRVLILGESLQNFSFLENTILENHLFEQKNKDVFLNKKTNNLKIQNYNFKNSKPCLQK
jgi:hypothetical protein